MLDKNGVELQAGMVVEITGAYFKNDNGFWFVENAPGDPSWCGSDCCLKKISKAGKISVAKRNICFWPIGVFVSDRCKPTAGTRPTLRSKSRRLRTCPVLSLTFGGWPRPRATVSAGRSGTLARITRRPCSSGKWWPTSWPWRTL